MAIASDRAHLNRLTESIIGCSYRVSRILGCGFLEKVYENALAHELRRCHIHVKQQFPIQVYYDDAIVGDYIADILVEEQVLVELKAVHQFDNIHKAQCLNYLNATGLHVCLLINFGKPRAEIHRIVRHF